MNVATGDLVIASRKAKVVSLVLLGIGMTGLSLWLFVAAPQITTQPTWYVRTVGGVGTVFFGFCTLLGVVQLFRRAPALIVDRQGIIDQTGPVAVGRVHWSEIRGFRVVTIRKVKFLVVDVHDPRKFIDRGNRVQRFLRAANARMVASPVALSSATLDIGFDQLVDTLSRHFDQAMGGRVSPPG